MLLSLVGRDLAEFNKALRQADLDRCLVRLSGALEENGLLACDGDRTGLLYAAMSSFVSLAEERHQALAERYATLFGPQAPVLDTYAAGIYDGLHLVAALANDHGAATRAQVRGARPGRSRAVSTTRCISPGRTASSSRW